MEIASSTRGTEIRPVSISRKWEGLIPTSFARAYPESPRAFRRTTIGWGVLELRFIRHNVMRDSASVKGK